MFITDSFSGNVVVVYIELFLVVQELLCPNNPVFRISHIKCQRLLQSVWRLKNSHGGLETSLYTKPTDAHLYLQYSSCHPKHQIRSIPFSQVLRIQHICSAIEEFDRHSKALIGNLMVRGYSRSLLEKAIQRARDRDRNQLLERLPTDPPKIIPLITTFQDYITFFIHMRTYYSKHQTSVS